jgi:23S rRNA (adenine2503-C2)-methyltransferase
MGEPLANVDRVIAAIRVMNDPCALAIDSRAITVCTSGLPSGIRQLAREVPKVRLGLSIGSARPAVRRRLMPIDAAHSLEDVLEAAEEHARATGLAPMWAVTPLADVNDTTDDAAALAALVRRFEERSGVRPRLSVVPYNAIDTVERDPFQRGDVTRFMERLAAAGARPHLRYSGGGDVAAACGQLAGLA